MVGGGTNLSCAFLYRRMNSQEDLAIGSTSKKEGDCFMFGVVFYINFRNEPKSSRCKQSANG